VAIGYRAIQTGNTGVNQIAIGFQAGQSGQGTAAIAIGALAGQTNQHNNSIVLNAQGTVLNSAAASACYIAPMRTGVTATTTYGVMLYDATNREVLYSANATSAGSKTFVIDHPNDKDRYLVHACLEGPEAGVYYRGKAVIPEEESSVIIQLPNYVNNLATDFTIQTTPIYDKDTTAPIVYRVTEVIDGKFVVFGPPGKFFWHVYGKRVDIEVEPRKSNVTVKGSGPYKWI
jgi:hypothetical protein